MKEFFLAVVLCLMVVFVLSGIGECSQVMQYRGLYDIAAEYKAQDVVSYQFCLYMALEPISGICPSCDLTKWLLVSCPGSGGKKR